MIEENIYVQKNCDNNKKKKFYSYTEFKIVRISAYHLCISPVRNFSPENKIEWSHSHILWVFFLFFFFYNNIFFFSKMAYSSQAQRVI